MMAYKSIYKVRFFRFHIHLCPFYPLKKKNFSSTFFRGLCMKFIINIISFKMFFFTGIKSTQLYGLDSPRSFTNKLKPPDSQYFLI